MTGSCPGALRQVALPSWCSFKSYLFELLLKLVGSNFNFSKDFADQGTGKISARMVWYSGCTAIRVPVKDMASFLPDGLETQVKEYFLHCLEVNNRYPLHVATSIC